MSELQRGFASTLPRGWLRLGVESSAPEARERPLDTPIQAKGRAENVSFSPGSTVVNDTRVTDVFFILNVESAIPPLNKTVVVEISTMPQPPNFSNIRVEVTGRWIGDRISADRVKFIDSGFVFERFRFTMLSGYLAGIFVVGVIGFLVYQFSQVMW